MTNTAFLGILAGIWALVIAFTSGLQQLCGRAKIGWGNNVASVLYTPRGCSTTLYPSDVRGLQGQPPPAISTLEPLDAAHHLDGVTVAILRYGTPATVLLIAVALALTAFFLAARYRRTPNEQSEITQSER